MADEPLVVTVLYVRIYKRLPMRGVYETADFPTTFLGIATCFLQITTHPGWGLVDLQIGLAHEDGRKSDVQYHFNDGRLLQLADPIVHTGELPLWHIHPNPDDPNTVILMPPSYTEETT